MTNKCTICLWYEGDALDAANFYTKTFPNSAVGEIMRAPSDYPDGKQGDILTVICNLRLDEPIFYVQTVKPIIVAMVEISHL